MRVTVHLTTGENVELDLQADEPEMLGVTVANGYPRTFVAPLWRRKGSTSSAMYADIVVAHIVHFVVHRAAASEAAP